MKKITLLILLLIFLIDANAQYAQEKIIYDFGRKVSGISAIQNADLDNDGDQDIIIASQNTNVILWMRNLGNGAFEEGSIISYLALKPEDISVADIDGNGTLDIVSASSKDNKIAWYSNNGQGVFGEQQIISSNVEQAKIITVVDMDSDNDLDLITSNYTNDIILWYENQGAGQFNPIENIIATGIERINKIIAKDIDDDGDKDIFFNTTEADRIGLLRNLGNGNFSEEDTLFFHGSYTPEFVLEDIDNDNDLDVVSTAKSASNSNYVFTFLNDGNGSFNQIDTLITNAGFHYTTYFSFEDINGDNHKDVIIAINNELSWHINEGNLNFSEKHIVQLGNSPKALKIFDVNGDNKSDLVLASTTNDIIYFNQTEIVENLEFDKFVSNNASDVKYVTFSDHDEDNDLDVLAAETEGIGIYINDGNGDFDKSLIETGQQGLEFVNFGDFNGDNSNDLISTSQAYYQNAISLGINDGTNQYPTFKNLTTLIREPHKIDFIDVNNDGKMDVLATTNGDKKISWFEHDDILNYEPKYNKLTASNSKALLAVDIDEDGDTDYINYLSSANGVVLHTNNNGLFTTTIIAPSTDQFIYEMKAADINGDGALDVLVGAQNGLYSYINDGSENFSFVLLNDSNTLLTAIDVADIDNDGDIDVSAYSSLYENRKIVYYKNDGLGNFNTIELISDAYVAYKDLVLADFDGDNLIDIAFTDQSNGIVWQRNLGGGVFNNEVQLSNISANQIKTFDLDSDGDLDIIFSSNSNSIHYLKNNSGSFSGQVELFDAVSESFDFADFDNDGNIDIVALSIESYQTIVWYQNNGSEIFTNKNEITSMLNSPRMIVDDVDGDGEQDVFAYTFIPTTFSGVGWFKNFGNGLFDINKPIATNIGYIYNSELVDMDGDNLEDIVLLTATYQGSSNRNIVWYKNNGDGSFLANSPIFTDNSFYLTSFDTGDIDGDGDLDVIAIKAYSNASFEDDVLLVRNDGNQNFDIDSIPMEDYIRCEYIKIKDVNADGQLDILISSQNQNYIIWLENLDNNQFSEPKKVSKNLANPIYTNAADLDGDNFPDVVAASSSDSKIVWYQNNGTDIITGETDSYLIYDEQYESVNIPPYFIIDTVDNDEFNDLLFIKNFTTANQKAFEIAELSNTDIATYEEIKLVEGVDRNYFEDQIFYADINMDGMKDLITTYNESNELDNNNGVIWFENLGDNNYSNTGVITLLNNTFDIVISDIADIDNDGKNDILCIRDPDDNTNNSNSIITILKHNDQGVFNTQETLETTGLQDVKIQLGDFDGDDDFDVVAVIKFPVDDESRFAYLTYQNNGSGVFVEGNPTILVNPESYIRAINFKLDIADLDKNGSQEILVAYQFETLPFCSHCPGFSAWQYSVYEYDAPQNTFSEISQSPAWPFPIANGYYDYIHPFFADVNNDGNTDMLTIDFYNNILWRLGDGEGNFPETLTVASNRSFFGLPIIKAADADNDNDLDVFVMTYGTVNHRFEVYENLTNQPDADEDGVSIYTDCDDENELIGDSLYAPSIESNTVLCEGEMFQFQLDTIFDGVDYLWFGPNGFTSEESEPDFENVLLADNGQYDVQLNTANCISDLAITNLEISEYPVVQLTETESTLEAQGTGISTYQWYLDGAIIDGANQMSYSFTETGDYHVVVSNDADCASNSDTISIVISGIFSQQNDLFEFYPNPINTNKTLQINLNSQTTFPIVFNVLNTAGQLVFEDQISTNNYELAIQNFPIGIYTLQLISANKVYAEQFIIVE